MDGKMPGMDAKLAVAELPTSLEVLEAALEPETSAASEAPEAAAADDAADPAEACEARSESPPPALRILASGRKRANSWAGRSSARSAAAGLGESVTLALMNAAERRERRRRRATIGMGELRTLPPPTLLAQLRAFYKADEGAAAELFTDKALLRREALRFSPRVAIWSVLFWRSIDLDNSNTLEEHEFMPYAMLLYKVLNNAWDESKARAACTVDWHSDRREKNFINCETFLLSLFQLADTWTENIDEGEMVEFLEILFNCIMRWDEPRGRFTLKSPDEVRAGECIAEVELARLRKQKTSISKRSREAVLRSRSFRNRRQSSLRSDSFRAVAAAAASDGEGEGGYASASAAERARRGLLDAEEAAVALLKDPALRRPRPGALHRASLTEPEDGGYTTGGQSDAEGLSPSPTPAAAAGWRAGATAPGARRAGQARDGGEPRGDGAATGRGSDEKGRSPPPKDAAGGWSLFHSLLQARDPRRGGAGFGRSDAEQQSKVAHIPAISEGLYGRLLGQRWKTSARPSSFARRASRLGSLSGLSGAEDTDRESVYTGPDTSRSGAVTGDEGSSDGPAAPASSRARAPRMGSIRMRATFSVRTPSQEAGAEGGVSSLAPSSASALETVAAIAALGAGLPARSPCAAPPTAGQRAGGRSRCGGRRTSRPPWRRGGSCTGRRRGGRGGGACGGESPKTEPEPAGFGSRRRSILKEPGSGSGSGAASRAASRSVSFRNGPNNLASSLAAAFALLEADKAAEKAAAGLARSASRRASAGSDAPERPTVTVEVDVSRLAGSGLAGLMGAAGLSPALDPLSPAAPSLALSPLAALREGRPREERPSPGAVAGAGAGEGSSSGSGSATPLSPPESMPGLALPPPPSGAPAGPGARAGARPRRAGGSPSRWSRTSRGRRRRGGPAPGPRPGAQGRRGRAREPLPEGPAHGHPARRPLSPHSPALPPIVRPPSPSAPPPSSRRRAARGRLGLLHPQVRLLRVPARRPGHAHRGARRAPGDGLAARVGARGARPRRAPLCGAPGGPHGPVPAFSTRSLRRATRSPSPASQRSASGASSLAAPQASARALSLSPSAVPRAQAARASARRGSGRRRAAWPR
eukprot:tig00020830_g14472.t1